MNGNEDSSEQRLESNVKAEQRLLVISGLSGSGISTALQALEDQGYFCVDNLPPPLIAKLLELASQQTMQAPLAIGLDARSIHDLESAVGAIQAIKSIERGGDGFQLIFLEASEEVRVKRFSTSRRSHPLTRGGLSLIEAMQHERQLMEEIRNLAHHLLDTSDWNVHECKRRIRELGHRDSTSQTMTLQVMSFGFRHGVPREADIVWDVRFLPNPHFDPQLRPLSGLDEPVKKVVLEHSATQNLLKRLLPLLTDCLPAYEQEGKSYLTIAIGCTGGHHRSVAVAETIASYLRGKDWTPQIRHRDLEKSY